MDVWTDMVLDGKYYEIEAVVRKETSNTVDIDDVCVLEYEDGVDLGKEIDFYGPMHHRFESRVIDRYNAACEDGGYDG